MTDNEHLNIDINDLTIAEVVEIEERTGLPLDALGQADKPKGKMLQALAFVSKRRDDPDFTWEMARRPPLRLLLVRCPHAEGLATGRPHRPHGDRGQAAEGRQR